MLLQALKDHNQQTKAEEVANLKEQKTIKKFHPIIQFAMRVYRSNSFHSFILFCISLNTICLSLDKFPNLPRRQVEVITLLNSFFTVVFYTCFAGPFF